MKKFLLIVPFLVAAGVSNNRFDSEPIVVLQPKEIKVGVTKPIELKPITDYVDWKPLILAMIQVESRGNDSAYNKREDAVGCLQIRPIMLRECNRILSLMGVDKEYTLEDRWSRTKSIEIFYVVNNHHHKNGTYEEIARAWNGGPNWAEKSGTKRYWKKVQKQLKKQSKKNERSDNRFTEV